MTAAAFVALNTRTLAMKQKLCACLYASLSMSVPMYGTAKLKQGDTHECLHLRVGASLHH
jgi:hypothetical protein